MEPRGVASEQAAHHGAPAGPVVDLTDPGAGDPLLTGGKAAALARAAAAGLDTLPGVVLTTAVAHAVDAGARVADHPAVSEAFARIDGERRPLVARSSSVLEDTSGSSMAGQFDSVIGITGFPAFATAVEAVLASRERAGAPGSPIAVLVQPLIEPRLGGVLFGIDPVTGRSDRRVVSAVDGGPEPLVSGEVDGSRYLLDTDARVLEHGRGDGPELGARDLRRLVALSDEVARTFGRPQDVEWAIGTDDRLWLLQSRPVTTLARGVPRGPVYGPGPLAETFPEPLTELEHDLWVPPLRDALRTAVVLAGAATPAEVAASEVIVSVAGHVAIDLRLAGDVPPPRGLLRRLNPVPAVRRLRSAWRVGRLRAALPVLADRLLERADADLEAVPPLADLTNRQLVALFHRGHEVLRALHAHEILIGMLTDTGGNRMTGASVALRVLAEAREEGLSDQEVLERSPVVLALTPPRVAPRPQLPAEAAPMHLGLDAESGNDHGLLREALRLRVRWLQELTGRAAWELGVRLTASGDIVEPDMIRHMTLEHVEAVFTKRALVVPALVQTHLHNFGDPLPARFQLSDRGLVIRTRVDGEVGGGTGAGGGTGSGPVTYDTDDPPSGSVLVTTTLTPGLGPLLTRLNGIVSETGSVLSHLAILAREAGVPIVVGYAEAVRELPEGTQVTVDGDSGQVTRRHEEGSS
ncbi:pyruvate, phosphate dikinase [Iamia sp. SCSIO 61187]|uniref:PEP/pyruvate-binding domain-containing protein n=1 Tax=Iamia sp. SCSIO 61187 TaxID=2722752 RepID=UPI001C630AFF|nr:PEP/pyruvate-binding domain-containing protein [Iamia sp. SCSIO 61187]QYG92277.1 pyruvate, phosphate dikinase [Iamia sp. SCSIO 61187]